MAGAGDLDSDAVLSDVEDDGGDSIPVETKAPSSGDVSVEKLREVLAELDRERQARVAAENTKSELQVSFNRLKTLAHEAIKKRDEFGRQRDDAVREKEETAKQLEENKKQLEETTKERDALRSEIGNSSHMLVTGMEKISAKVSNFAGSALPLPRSQKYTGMAAVAYGIIKRANEIVEELLKQNEAAVKARNEAREQMEQRNYEIAIEVSQLEATISGLRDEVAKKVSIVEDLERDLAVRDKRLNEVAENLSKEQSEALQLKDFVGECEDKLSSLESRIESQRPLLIDQLSLVSKIHNQICSVVKIIDDDGTEELSESLFVPQETDVEENIRASLAGMESIFELTKIVVQKAKEVLEEKNSEIKSLDETVARLVREKDQIGSLLRSALSKRMAIDPSSRKNELFQAAENGLREAGIDFKFSKLLGDGKVAASNEKLDRTEKEEDEIYSLAGALEDVVKASQLEIIELKHTVGELRAELSLLKQHVEAQAKELDQRMHRIEELEEKERVANENIEGLMMDIAAAEEEINRWKVAAEQEADAGRGVEQEFVSQLAALKQELEESKQSMLESEKKLKFKEETAAAAMAARDAAEKSLKLADLRSSRLRDRVEELTHQLEDIENREDSKGQNRPRYVCWPWQWLGMDFVGFQQRPATQQEASNEMELSEPLL
ncbi:filament-like plant protein 3 [Vigna umbellata]|uniref:filament-like plant protein 3 n=1 Tax=Vigna umbellata TaxID=87088 RepID=UPI001F5F4436|nr:filament-like plant protein 3 [Vigna umbellata]